MKPLIITAAVVALYLIGAGATYRHLDRRGEADRIRMCSHLSTAPFESDVLEALQTTAASAQAACLDREHRLDRADATMGAIFWPVVAPVLAGLELVGGPEEGTAP